MNTSHPRSRLRYLASALAVLALSAAVAAPAQAQTSLCKVTVNAQIGLNSDDLLFPSYLPAGSWTYPPNARCAASPERLAMTIRLQRKEGFLWWTWWTDVRTTVLPETSPNTTRQVSVRCGPPSNNTAYRAAVTVNGVTAVSREIKDQFTKRCTPFG